MDWRKQIFGFARKLKWIQENPFDELVASVTPTKRDSFLLNRKTIAKAIEAAPMNFGRESLQWLDSEDCESVRASRLAMDGHRFRFRTNPHTFTENGASRRPGGSMVPNLSRASSVLACFGGQSPTRKQNAVRRPVFPGCSKGDQP